MAEISEEIINKLTKKFNSGKSYEEEYKSIPSLTTYFLQKGPSNFRLHFWMKTSIDKKESFIRGFFNYLIEVPSEKKLDLLKLLRNLFIDQEESIKEKLLMIFYAALFEKKNYKISLSALDFFITTWKFFAAKEKNNIFGKLLDFMEMADYDIADEGINAVGGIIDELSLNQRKEYFNKLFEISIKKNEYLSYICFENLLILIKNYPEEFPSTKKTSTFKKIEIIAKKNKKLKDSKYILSLLRLYIHFESLFDKNNERFFQERIDLCMKEDKDNLYKEILQILLLFWPSIKFISYDNALDKVTPFILRIYKNKNSYNEYVVDLLAKYSQLVWDYLPNEEKKNFY